MGNLLNVLSKDGKRPTQDVFLDFENAQPTPEEEEVHARVAAVLSRSGDILNELDNYKGAGDSIRQAISHPANEDFQNEAWQSVCPLVSKLKTFWLYSADIETVLPMVLEALCAQSPMEALEQKQATAKQFAEIIQFVMRFDDMKMTNPAIQNDFSYYRRTLSRKKMSNPGGDDDSAVVTHEEANRMSLFYAYPTPMLKALSDTTYKFVTESKAIPVENTTDCLSAMASVCRTMIETPEYHQRFADSATILFCQRVMVGTIILYDHVHNIGAFSKKNPSIDIPRSIKVLKMHQNPHLEALMNALRYTTKHLNDEDTPKSVKALLA
eukprot:m.10367 g.10367  ORF g.10367 m.10367 type:complete len:325 (-) comp5883_c0_seq1:117-1091(-)